MNAEPKVAIRKTLLVEDEEPMADLVIQTITPHGYQVVWEEDPTKAFARAKSSSFDLILLDLNLGGASGEQLLKDLRRARQTRLLPIVVITGNYDPEVAEGCLEAGADDYVRKPFHEGELVARLHAVARRIQHAGSPLQVLAEGPVRLDLFEARLTLAGQEIPLTPTELRILETLLINPGRVIERRYFLRELWSLSLKDWEKVNTRTLETHIRNIRRKFGPYTTLIQTAAGLGYFLSLETVTTALPDSTR